MLSLIKVTTALSCFPMLCNRHFVLTGTIARHSYQKYRQEDPSAGFLTNPYKKRQNIYACGKIDSFSDSLNLTNPFKVPRTSRTIERWEVVGLYYHHCFALVEFLGSTQHVCKL